MAFIGEESIRAAEASECAAEQGQFWPYHDTIFLNQNGENLGAFSDRALKSFAVALGNLDTAAFNQCLDEGRYRQEVRDETAEASSRGVSSTPTLIINGTVYEGGLPFESIQQIVQRELGG
jgi:protein-disulfide isomerase